MFDGIDALKELGFEGFWTVGQLRHTDWLFVPDKKGVYLALWTEGSPDFMEESTATDFKGRDPSVDTSILYDRWLDDTVVIYIGKAGGTNSRATLRTRLHQFLQFGAGARACHWGGRFVWQLIDSDLMKVCWKPIENDEPAVVERLLIMNFKAQHGGMRPFANLRG